MIERSGDGAVKFAFRLEDGAVIESVLIPEEDRNTPCASPPQGCAKGCTFCLTGAMGFRRNLTTAEIVNQVCAVRDWMLKEGRPPLTNLVFMAREPLDWTTCSTPSPSSPSSAAWTSPTGASLSPPAGWCRRCAAWVRRPTSTWPSPHAVDDAVRSRLMPVNRTYPISELVETCRTYRQKRRKRIMFEYTLLEGVNDSDADARRPAALLAGVPCKINLLAMNPVADSPVRSLAGSGCSVSRRSCARPATRCSFRQSRGEDIRGLRSAGRPGLGPGPGGTPTGATVDKNEEGRD